MSLLRSVFRSSRRKEALTKLSLLTSAATILFCAHPCVGQTQLVDEKDLPIGKVSVAELSALKLEPAEFTLSGSRQRLQLLATGTLPSKETADLTRYIEYEIANPNIATINKRGFVMPKSNGKTKISIRSGGRTATADVIVTGMAKTEPVSFNFQTLPVLSKLGCSQGACHGSPHGKGGFRLSLRAFDPKLDEYTTIHEEFGRRINPIEPGRSLLLAKPLTEVSHQGGQRLKKTDAEYQLLRDWIAEGTKIDADAAKCESIRVTPNVNTFRRRPHHVQQFRVEAKFSDGSIRDVTHLSVFESSDENVCKVSRHGLAVGLKRGEAAVIVRYLDKITSTLMGFVEDVPGFAWKAPAPESFIDRHVHAKLKQFRFHPAELASDEVFLRRVYLDVTGLLPPPEGARAFIEDNATDKRARLIDELLDTREHAAFWATKWGDLFRVSTKQIGHAAVFKYNRWLHESIRDNKPYDQFAREILMATGSTLVQPQGNYFRTAADTSDVTETTSQLFLGARIGCAKCHNHPFESWTQNNYYGLSSFFNQIGRKKTNRDGETIIYATHEGEVRHPATDKVMKPWAPGGDIRIKDGDDRRKAFVEWLTSTTNPYFAKVEANRIWANVMGRGIVEPFDDFRDSNPPANAELLDALADDFVANGFDRKDLLRKILNSRTYQASSQADKFNREDTKYFSRYMPRRLMAEQLIDALGEVTGIREQFKFVPQDTKATQLPAPDLKPQVRAEIGNVEFLKIFGQPERQTACECERGDETSLGQALELYNGTTVHSMLTKAENRIHQSLIAKMSPKEIIEDFYWRSFSRPPTGRELEVSLNYIESSKDGANAFEDLVWALINKDEFLFQH